MVLAVDLGQSGTRLKWSGGHFESSRAKRAAESPLEALREVFDEFLEFHRLHFETVALSLSGFYGQVPDPQPYGQLVEEYFHAKDVAVIDDGLAGLIGALGLLDGVALSVGSGVVAVAARQGEFAHADGLGLVFGDIGGGFWLGKHALERALATRQGRADDKALLDYLHEEITEFDQLENYAGTEAIRLCISSAKKVLEAAQTNIDGARNIRSQGAQELANTVKAAWLGVGGLQDEHFALALLGGLSRNRGYEDEISQGVLRMMPHAKKVNVAGTHLDGAITIATSMKEDRPPLLRWWHKP